MKFRSPHKKYIKKIKKLSVLHRISILFLLLFFIILTAVIFLLSKTKTSASFTGFTLSPSSFNLYNDHRSSAYVLQITNNSGTNIDKILFLGNQFGSNVLINYGSGCDSETNDAPNAITCITSLANGQTKSYTNSYVAISSQDPQALNLRFRLTNGTEISAESVVIHLIDASGLTPTPTPNMSGFAITPSSFDLLFDLSPTSYTLHITNNSGTTINKILFLGNQNNIFANILITNVSGCDSSSQDAPDAITCITTLANGQTKNYTNAYRANYINAYTSFLNLRFRLADNTPISSENVNINFINSLNLPPTVGTITVPVTIGINTSFTATANFTYPGFLDTHTASWNWGDGNTTAGTVTESNGSGSVSNTHTYATAGSFTITLSVTSNKGLTGTGQTIVAVSPASNGGLSGVNLMGINYNGANLSNQNLSGSNLKDGTFISTNFQNANLSGINAKNVNFQNANFTGANLTGSNFSGANLTNANMTKANLTGSNFKNAVITGVVWSNTICPNGTNSNNDANTCVGQGGGL